MTRNSITTLLLALSRALRMRAFAPAPAEQEDGTIIIAHDNFGVG